MISIHAPRMGSDMILTGGFIMKTDFNPRSPHGERLRTRQTLKTFVIFQSTLPAWGATNAVTKAEIYLDISIHAPRMGSD